MYAILIDSFSRYFSLFIQPYFESTVKPVHKGHPREKQNMVFIDKWSLFGGYFVLFYQGSVTEV